MIRRILLILAVLTLFVQPIVGEDTETDWKQHVISTEDRTFNFQTVARGAAPTHQFVIRNPLQEDLHIGEITSSCVCVTIDYDEEKTVLKTYEELVIPARFRGDLFLGPRNSTITIPIVEPVRAEIHLQVRGEIRNDISISPEFINFGNLALGTEHTRTLTVTYTGQNTLWRIVDARSENEFIRATITPAPAQGGAREFRVTVTIDRAAPNGVINSHLVLINNDSNAARREIPISIRATVGNAVRVTPDAVSLGILSPGEPSGVREARVVGTRPFRITEIIPDNPAIEVRIVQVGPARESVAERVYPLIITYRNPIEGEGAPGENGIMQSIVRITTDVPGVDVAFSVTATVLEREPETLSSP